VPAPRDVNTIAIIGARAAGREIATAVALGGYRAVIEDVSPETVEEALAYVLATLQKAVTRGEITEDQKHVAVARVSTTRSVEDACRLADMLLEAGPEELELKLEIFTLFDRFAKPGAILASNTSSVSITDLANITFRGENCIGMRFTYGTASAGGIKITRGQETSDATVAACAEVARRMGRDVELATERANG
jgi:3-hydroxybutyryl-CoA dehydrogenase